MIQTIDVTGLPQEVVKGLQSVVDGIRQSLRVCDDDRNVSNGTSADAWVADFMAWAASHPVRKVAIDDCRATIYAGRGE